MSPPSLQELEVAVLARNPLLWERLEPGLPAARVRRMLERKMVKGEIECLIRLYTWRNGTLLSQHASLDRGFLLGLRQPYHFPDLEMAIGHFIFFREAAVKHPRISEAVGRYFPAFWDGSTSWLAVDLQAGHRNRVMVIEYESRQPFRKAYNSFDEFLAEAIRANAENRRLNCFE